MNPSVATQLHAGPDAGRSEYAAAAARRRQARREHFDRIAERCAGWRRRSACYHDSIARLVRFLQSSERAKTTA